MNDLKAATPAQKKALAKKIEIENASRLKRGNETMLQMPEELFLKKVRGVNHFVVETNSDLEGYKLYVVYAEWGALSGYWFGADSI